MSSVYSTEPPTEGLVLLRTTLGDIRVGLWPKQAPLACRNFVQLCLDGYYDDTTFHRVVKGLLVQGGDPTGTGRGGESAFGGYFRDEHHSRLSFSHRGIVACAKGGGGESSGDGPGSASAPPPSRAALNGSQFFITLAPAPGLDRTCTIFGRLEGDSIFALLRCEDLEVGGEENDVPLHPPRVLEAVVEWNPFEGELAPRVDRDGVRKAREAKELERKAQERRQAFAVPSAGGGLALPAGVRKGMVSFMEREEEEEEEEEEQEEEGAGNLGAPAGFVAAGGSASGLAGRSRLGAAAFKIRPSMDAEAEEGAEEREDERGGATGVGGGGGAIAVEHPRGSDGRATSSDGRADVGGEETKPEPKEFARPPARAFVDRAAAKASGKSGRAEKERAARERPPKDGGDEEAAGARGHVASPSPPPVRAPRVDENPALRSPRSTRPASPPPASVDPAAREAAAALAARRRALAGRRTAGRKRELDTMERLRAFEKKLKGGGGGGESSRRASGPQAGSGRRAGGGAGGAPSGSVPGVGAGGAPSGSVPGVGAGGAPSGSAPGGARSSDRGAAPSPRDDAPDLLAPAAWRVNRYLDQEDASDLSRGLLGAIRGHRLVAPSPSGRQVTGDDADWLVVDEREERKEERPGRKRGGGDGGRSGGGRDERRGGGRGGSRERRGGEGGWGGEGNGGRGGGRGGGWDRNGRGRRGRERR